MTLPHFTILFDTLPLYFGYFHFSFRLIDYFILDLDFADCAENCKTDGVTDNVHEMNIVILFYVDINKVCVI